MRTLLFFFQSLPQLFTRARLVLFLYGANLLAALVVLLPLGHAFEAAFGRSVAGKELGDGSFLEHAWQDFHLTQGDLLEVVGRGFSAVGAVALLLSFTLLSAVTFAVVATPRGGSPGTHSLNGIGRLAASYLRLLVLFAAAAVGLFWVNRGLTLAVQQLISVTLERASPSRYVGWTLLAKSAYMALLLCWLVAATGLAKARIACSGRRSMIKAFFWGWKQVLSKPFSSALLGAFGPLMLVGTVGLYALLRDQLPAGASTLVQERVVPTSLLLIALSQLVALLQQGTTVVWTAMFVRFHHHASLPAFQKAAPVPAALPPSPPPPAAPITHQRGVTAARGGRLVLIAAPLLLPALLARDASGQEPPHPAPPLPAGPFQQKYVIQATLDPKASSVDGSVRVEFTNPGPNPVSELLFHLYMNAFSGPDTLWMRERRVRTATDPLAGLGTAALGETTLAAITNGATGRALASKVDETVLTVTLPRPLAPLATAAVDLSFHTKMPSAGLSGRGGFQGDHFDGMHWFPKLGVFRNGRFDCEPFHTDTEFFGEFASYDVTLTLPERFVVGATGKLVESSAAAAATGSGPLRSHHYVADAVHDFAWCADPHFVRFDDVHHFDTHDVAIRYLCQPYAVAKAPLVLATVRRCLALYGEWFLEYPYETLTVDGLPMGLGGGMEYPNLFTISQGFPNHLSWLVDHTEDPAGVTAHEFGHQYWYGILGSDEFTEAWLDEGVNTYVTAKIEEQQWPVVPGRALQASEWREVVAPFLVSGLGIELCGQPLGLKELVGFDTSPFTTNRRGKKGDPTLLGFDPSIDRMPGFGADRFLGRRTGFVPVAAKSALRDVSFALHPKAYSPIIYGKTALALATLERIYGWEPMRRALRDYALRHRFSHPTGDDFLGLLAEVLSRESTRKDRPVEPLLREMWQTADLLDLAVTEARSDEVPAAKGAPRTWRSTVVVENLGTARLPADIQLHFADGSRGRDEWLAWPPEQRFLVIERTGPEPLEWAAVDPQHQLLLDVDWCNNGRTVAKNCETLRKLGGTALWWIECGLALMRSFTGP